MKNMLLEYYPTIDYAVVARIRNGEVFEFVAAWGYNSDSDSWAQGHYFTSLSNCMAYINRKLSEV